MKKIMALFFLLLVHPFLFASWNIGLDAMALDALWNDSMRFDVEGGYCLGDVRISGAIGYGANLKDELMYINGALCVDVYPFDNIGFYVGSTLLRVGYLFGLSSPDDAYLLSSEARIGWSIEFPYFYLEPRISFSDTLSDSDSTLSVLREFIDQYSSFRISLLLGVSI